MEASLAVIMIHGFWSSGATWNKLIYVLRSDADLANISYNAFQYDSPKLRMPVSRTRIPDYNDIARSLPSYIESVAPAPCPLIVVTHSQGGLIFQRFLSWMVTEGRASELSRFTAAVLLACPNEGSEYLRTIRTFAGFRRNPQANALRVLDNEVGESRRIVLRQIINATVEDDRNCRIPFFVYSGSSDRIVTLRSAQSTFPMAEALPGDHSSILDPAATGNITAPAIKRIILGHRRRQRKAATPLQTGPSEAGEEDRQRQYIAALRNRYRYLDLEVLAPTDLDEQPRIQLHDVFVPQRLRTHRRHIELPKEVWRRVVFGGDPFQNPGLPATPTNSIQTRRPSILERRRRERLESIKWIDADVTSVEIVQQLRAEQGLQRSEAVLEVLRNESNRRCVILGDPGSGKSTLLQYLAVTTGSTQDGDQRAPSNSEIPILVQVRRLLTSGNSNRWFDRPLLENVARVKDVEGSFVGLADLEEYSRNGRAVWLFDGLDEIFDPADRESFVRQVATFASLYPQARIILTSRILGYKKNVLESAGFTHFTIEDLQPNEIYSFIRTWYQLAVDDPAEAQSLAIRTIEAVQSSPSIFELATNPLLLTILTMIGRRRTLPRERIKVYQHAAAMLVEHWDVNRFLRDRRIDMQFIDGDDKVELLQQVALYMHGLEGDSAGGNSIPRNELLIQIQSYLTDRYNLGRDRTKPVALAMLDQLRERNFILSRYGFEQYGFVHRGFLEYFTASGVIQRRATSDRSRQAVLEIFRSRAMDPSWTEVILLVASLIDAELLAECLGSLIGASRGVDALGYGGVPPSVLACRALIESRRPGRLSDLGAQCLGALVDSLQTINAISLNDGPEDDWRSLVGYVEPLARAIRELRETWPGRDQVRGRLEAFAFSIARGEARRLALTVAGCIFVDSTELRQRMVSVASDSNASNDEAAAALSALATAWPDKQSQSFLVRVIREGRQSPPRLVAAVRSVFEGAGTTEALNELRNVAVNSPHAAVREAAILKLASVSPGEETLSLLARIAWSTDEGQTVRATAVRLYSQIAPDRAAKELVLGLARDEVVLVRQSAIAEIAARWSGAIEADMLLRMVDTIPDDLARQGILRTWAQRTRSPSAKTRILDDQRISRSSHIRRFALETMADCWPDEASALMVSVVNESTDNEDRLHAFSLLVEMELAGERDLAVLRAAMRSLQSRTGTVQAVAKLAARMPDLLSQDAVLDLLLSTHLLPEQFRAVLATLVAGWPERMARRLLVELSLKAPSQVQVVSLAMVAQRWPDHSTVELLMQSLDSPYASKRAAAIEYLAAIVGDPVLLDRVKTVALGDKDPDVRRTARRLMVDGLQR